VNVFQVSSTWLTVNMALGRYFAICRPLHARGYINARGTRLTVVLIFLGAGVFNLPRFWHYRAVETRCDWLLANETHNVSAYGPLMLPPADCHCAYYSKASHSMQLLTDYTNSSNYTQFNSAWPSFRG